MDVDEDDEVVLNKRKVKKQIIESDDEEEQDNEVIAEYDVVVCSQMRNAELFCVQFPKRKGVVFDADVNPRMRYKKNVRMMEVRLAANVYSGSYDKGKLGPERAKNESPVKNEFGGFSGRTDEVFEGRAYPNENPVQNAVGFVRHGVFYLAPIAGLFNMNRTINGPVAAGGKKDEEEDVTFDSDSDAPSGSQQLRVKFSRPETERQKKRREASALYREKMIANDQWINMDVHLKGTPAVSKKTEKLIPSSVGETDDASMDPSMREIALNAIICGRIEQLDLSRENQLMSLQRIKDLPLHLQVHAQVLKARVISTENIRRLVEGMDRNTLFENLRRCAHLVQGVWVLRSDQLFNGLPPAHCNTPGRIDERRTDVWREARDLALCLIVAGQRVNRMTLSRCFKLDNKDAEEILSTFGVKADRTWKLKIPADQEFLSDPDNLPLLVEERRFWSSRWAELQQKLTPLE